MEFLAELAAQRVRHVVFVERVVHCPEPFVAFASADRERKMPSAQPRVAVTFDVGLRTAGPVRELQMKLVA